MRIKSETQEKKNQVSYINMRFLKLCHRNCSFASRKNSYHCENLCCSG